MSASNLFDDIEGDDDIFSTPVAKTPKKKKGWMDDLLDDESELFKSGDKDDVKKPEPVKEKGAGPGGKKTKEWLDDSLGDESDLFKSVDKDDVKEKKGAGLGVKSSGGGLFDDFSLDEPEDKPSASVNGHKDNDEEFVVVSHDEVPSAEEAEKMAATVSPGEGQASDETDGQQQSDELFNQNLSYEERARIRREQRRKRAEDRARSQSNTPSPQPDTQEDPKRDQRSASPSPSPDSSVESGKDAPSAPQPTDHTDMVTGGNDKKEDTPSPSPEPDDAPEQDAAEQVWILTKSLQRAQAENAQLQSDNDSLNAENKSLRDRVAELEKQLNSKNKEVEDLTTAHQKQVSDLEQQLKQKTKEIEDMKSTKKVEHKHEPKDHHKREPRGTPVTMVALKKTATHSPAGSPATKSKFRAGVDKGRPITSVADSVKKFSGATPATDVKKSHTVVTTKAKHSSPSHAKHEEKPPPAKKTVTTLPSKPPPSPKPSGRIAHHDKHEHHAHPAKPHPPHGHADTHHHKAEHPSKTVRVTTHKKPHPHHHHHHHHHAHTDRKGTEHHVKKMEGEKKTEEATVSKEEPKAEPEAVAPPTEQAPPTEPKEEVSGESDEKKVEEKPTQSVTDETTRRELEKDTTRAKRVISIFENKTTPTQETPAWKVNAQQQREEKEKLEREKEAERQKEKEREESAEPEKSRTSSNASSSKDPEPVVNGNADAASAESAEKESESVDGAQLSKTRSQSSPLGTASKSTSSLPNTNKNDEVIPRDNKMRKTTSSSNNIMADPKKRLMAEDVKGKRSSWAAPKREECAVCGKVVYVMERLEADKVVYHKTCFKCTVCNKTLSTGTYAALQGKTYCKVHFKQLFKMKGNYDEGFGREQHKTKWIKKDPLDGESEA